MHLLLIFILCLLMLSATFRALLKLVVILILLVIVFNLPSTCSDESEHKEASPVITDYDFATQPTPTPAPINHWKAIAPKGYK